MPQPKYIGQACVLCGKIFDGSDDVVVCPECGSPYHRDCYVKAGKCVNTALHEKKEEWKPAESLNESTATSHERVCGNCGAKNDASAAYCANCGCPISDAAQSENARRSEGSSQQFGGQQFGGQPFGGQYGMPPFMNVHSISAETSVDENTVGEYSDYVGMKAFYYIPKFMKFSKTGSKLSVNFAALFFTPFWFAYRKMTVYAVLSCIITAIATVPNLFVNLTQVMGMSIPWVDTGWFAAIYYISYILNNVMKIVAAVFGNYLYYKKAKADISSIKATVQEPTSFRMAVAERGGVSMVYLVISFAVSFVATYALSTAMMLVFGMPVINP